MKALVLGCGPAGLLAVHALHYTEGVQVTVVSRKQRSPLFGCQYLHGPIPGFNLPTTTVHYELVGDAESYRHKVYGTTPGITVSPESLSGEHPAWDIRHAYDRLWHLYQGLIVNAEITPEDVPRMLDYYQPDLVVSSIPAGYLCQEPSVHGFASVESWALGDAPALGQSVPVPCPENTVLCNGTRDTGWYRVANVFGHKTAEWPGLGRKPPLSNVVRFAKPLATTCTCYPDVLRVGRYGRWQKGVLSHSAFNDTVATLAEGKVVTS